MNQEHIKRKLSGILSADVVGYSRLMRENETSTVRNLEEYKKLIFKLVEEYEGRIVDAPGDNILAEFSSVVKTVDCAVKIQKELKIKNSELIENRRMKFRIGINLGDVIEEDGRIYGDGVNIAARIEGYAQPEGICISRTAYDQVKTKLDLGYEYLGEHNVKNIDEPVRIYRVLMGFMSPGKAIGEKAPVGDVEKEIKTVAIIPFVNLSPDPEQEYFVDGLSEELLNSLTQIDDLRVIARTSSFVFKGSVKKVQEIGMELGADHLLEGSVRKAGNAIRITAQLISAGDGVHLWSKSYNRDLKDIFAVQEEIATAVADELKVTLGIKKSHRKLGDTDNEKAYELYLVALGQENKGDYSLALKSIDETISVDPKFALAWAEKATIHIALSVWSTVDRVVTEQNAALSAAQKAIELEPKLGVAYIDLGFINTTKGNWIEGEFANRKALELTTETSTLTSVFIPIHYTVVGHYKKAFALLETARRNDPLNPRVNTWYFFILGLKGNMRRAEEEYERINASSSHQYANDFISRLRLGTGNVVSRDDIVYSTPVFDLVKEYFDSPSEGLAELHKLYSDKNNLSEADITDISICAAYFGDTELAMDAMEKGIKINGVGLFKIWLPVMREVRQLPRFKEFVREIGLVDYWNRFGWFDLCRLLDKGDFECD